MVVMCACVHAVRADEMRNEACLHLVFVLLLEAREGKLGHGDNGEGEGGAASFDVQPEGVRAVLHHYLGLKMGGNG